MKKFFSLIAFLLITLINEHVINAQCTPAGDPSVFGDHVWNVYAWNAGDGTAGGGSWTDNYSGYYVETDISFITDARWWSNPSTASGYQGCPVGDDNHSWSAKRRGFPSGRYEINIWYHDDGAQLFVNGVNVWEHIGCCDQHPNVWSGCLNDSSTVEFRGSEATGDSYAIMELYASSVLTVNGPSTICPGYTLQLTASGGESYLWSTGDTTQSISVNSTGNYSVDITNACEVVTSSAAITVAAMDTPAISSNSAFNYCPGTGAYLSIDNSERYSSVSWSNGATSVTNNITGGGPYSVTVGDALGCSATSHATVTGPPGDPTEFGNHVWKVYAYNGGSSSISSGWKSQDYAGYYIDNSFNFSTSTNWASSKSPSWAPGYQGCSVNNDNHSWSAKRKGGFSCGVYKISVTGHIGPGQLFVDGVKVWEHNSCCDSHANAATVILNDSSKVEFRVTAGTGSSFGAISFTPVALVVGVTGHQLVCTGQYYTLSVPTGSSYLWSNGATTNPLQAGESGEYSVTVTDAQGCTHTSDTVSATILADEAPVANITASPGGFCDWDTNPITLTSDSTTGNSWSTNENTQSISVSQIGTYNLSVTNSAGCFEQSSITIEKGYTPPAPIAGNNGPVCENSSVNLTASGLAPGGQAASFNATLNQYVFVNQDIPENDFTIELWVKTTAVNTSIFSAGDNALSNDRNLYINNGLLVVYSPPFFGYTAPFVINDGKWHHIALVVQTGVGQVVYVDGISSGLFDSFDHSTLTSQTYFLIGATFGASATIDGQIDNVRIWSEPRTQTDIRNNMFLETPSSTTNLVYEATLNGNVNATIGNSGSTQFGVSYANTDYYTYTWMGPNAPSPSTNEIQTVPYVSASATYSVTASAGGCSPSTAASTDVVINPPVSYYTDDDGDGYGSSISDTLVFCADPGWGYVTNNSDCDDENYDVNPAATEVCNNTDDDCNGQVDEGVTTTFYADADGDGYGNPGVLTQACSAPSEYVTDNTDCNDADGTKWQSASLYIDADGDGYDGGSTIVCYGTTIPSGYSSATLGTDCNDTSGAIHPGAAEMCNGIDDDCNGTVDDHALIATISPSGTLNYCSGTVVTLTANSGAGISYQWIKGKNNISGATASIYSTTKKGSYKVKETNTYGCSSTSAVTKLVSIPKPTASITALGSLDICGTGSVVLQANSGAGYTYQWIKGKNNISGATNQNYTATTKGTYKCVVSNSSGCSATSNQLKVTKSCRVEDMNDLASSNLKIYPNPTTGNFVIELTQDEVINGTVYIQVMNTIGQLIFTEESQAVDGVVKEEIHLGGGISGGIYFVRVIAGDDVATSQLIITE